MKVGEFVNVSKRMVKEYFNRYVASPNGFQPIKSTDVKTVIFDSDDYMYDIYLVVPNTDYVIYAVRYDKFAKKICSTILNNIPDVIWGDGSKTIVKCSVDDVFDPEKGLAMAISEETYKIR